MTSKCLKFRKYQGYGLYSFVRTVEGETRVGPCLYVPALAQTETSIVENPKVGISIEPFTIEKRGTHYLGVDSLHYVRVYADGTEERI